MSGIDQVVTASDLDEEWSDDTENETEDEYNTRDIEHVASPNHDGNYYDIADTLRETTNDALPGPSRPAPRTNLGRSSLHQNTVSSRQNVLDFARRYLSAGSASAASVTPAEAGLNSQSRRRSQSPENVERVSNGGSPQAVPILNLSPTFLADYYVDS